MLTKEKVIETVKLLPDDFTTEELIERIIFVEKVEAGLEDSKNGRVTSLEDVKKEMRTWLK